MRGIVVPAKSIAGWVALNRKPLIVADAALLGTGSPIKSREIHFPCIRSLQRTQNLLLPGLDRIKLPGYIYKSFNWCHGQTYQTGTGVSAQDRCDCCNRVKMAVKGLAELLA